MTSAQFFVVDAFTETPFSGNPAGVVLPAAPLTEKQMQTLAGELHLETAFAVPSRRTDADYEVAYYTAAKRIPLCGHDTVALVTVLNQLGRLPTSGTIQLATDVGILSVMYRDGSVTLPMALPSYGQSVSTAETADALGLPPSEISDTGLPVQVVSVGTPFLIVPVLHRAALNALAPDMAALIAFGETLPDFADGFYLWSRETLSPTAHIHARCFAPAAGLPEDPVTGTASGAVGAYLARLNALPSNKGFVSFLTEQGFAMDRPGTVEVRIELEGSHVTEIAVRGSAVIVGEGTIRI